MRRLRAVIGFAGLLFLPVVSGVAYAGTCTPTLLHGVADGQLLVTTVDNTNDISAVFWFEAGRSYSVQVTEPDYAGDLTTFFSAAHDACPTVDAAGWQHTEAIAPVIDTATAQRASFTATLSDFYVARIGVTSGTHTVTVSASETTLFSPAWSTNGTYNTYYSFFNTTKSTIDVTLTLTKTDGSAAGTTTVAVPAGKTAATNTVALATPRSATGTAVATHDGPPGAILVEADIANFTLSPPYIQPVKFAATRETQH
jgi:hypothetical protein